MLLLSNQLAMEIDPDYGEVYFNYGNLLSDEGEYEAAAARYLCPHLHLLVFSLQRCK